MSKRVSEIRKRWQKLIWWEKLLLLLAAPFWVPVVVAAGVFEAAIWLIVKVAELLSGESHPGDQY